MTTSSVSVPQSVSTPGRDPAPHSAPTHLPDVPLFDAHVHVIDPRFPLVPNRGFLPDPYTVADYRRSMAHHQVCGGAVVSGSFQADDQQYLRAALAELGEGWVGVTQLPPDADAALIRDLHAAGVRALRFNLVRGPFTDLETLVAQAVLAHDLVGWHAEIFVESHVLEQLTPVLHRLPAFGVDHLGMTDRGLHTLIGWVERGARVKVSGFGRLGFDVVEAMRRIHATDPSALVFGTDLPGTRSPRAFRDADLAAIAEAVGDDDLPRVLAGNGRAWYGLTG
jgi:predicted TIM-barrel fold metal-dependent hydrolase